MARPIMRRMSHPPQAKQSITRSITVSLEEWDGNRNDLMGQTGNQIYYNPASPGWHWIANVTARPEIIGAMIEQLSKLEAVRAKFKGGVLDLDDLSHGKVIPYYHA